LRKTAELKRAPALGSAVFEHTAAGRSDPDAAGPDRLDLHGDARAVHSTTPLRRDLFKVIGAAPSATSLAALVISASRIRGSNAAWLALDIGSYGTRDRENGRPSLMASCSASNAESNDSAVSSQLIASHHTAGAEPKVWACERTRPLVNAHGPERLPSGPRKLRKQRCQK
jgi:hypothetical protein